MLTPQLPTTLASARVWAARGGWRAASPRMCRCGALVLVGPDADRGAGIATVDLTPLDPTGEALAVLAGRATYAATRPGNSVILTRRSKYQSLPALSIPCDIYPAHQCGNAIQDHLAPTRLVRPTTRKNADEPAPF